MSDGMYIETVEFSLEKVAFAVMTKEVAHFYHLRRDIKRLLIYLF